MGDMNTKCQHDRLAAYCDLCLADKIEAHGIQVFGENKLDPNEESLIVCALRRTAPEARRTTDLERKVAAFSMLPDGWNSYGAKALPQATITLAMEIAAKLGDDWKAVPVADGAIEFYRSNEDEIVEVRTCFDPEPLPQPQVKP